MKYKCLKKITAVFLLCVFALSFSVMSVGAVDNELGSITIRINEKAEGIGLKLIEVADYVNGNYKLNSNFSQCKVDFSGWEDADNAQKIANTLEHYAKSNNINGITTDIQSDGNAYFTNLSPDKLYLIIQPNIETYYVIQPLIVTLPYLKDGNQIYDVDINAKFTCDSSNIESAVILNKLGDNNKPLSGAVFDFQSKVYYNNSSEVSNGAETGSDSQGKYYWKSYASNLVTNSQGQIVVEKIPFGTYRFIEIQAPDGYELDSTPQEFALTAHGSVKLENERYVLNTGTIKELTFYNKLKDIESSVPSKPAPPVKTSDDSNNTPYIIMLSIAAVLIFATIKSFSLRKNNS